MNDPPLPEAIRDASGPPVFRAPATRPPISVVVPFAGGPDEAAWLLDALSRLIRGTADELIVVDNRGQGSVDAAAERRPDTGARVVPAIGEHSSYYARNVGAESAGNDWLLFLDADCEPDPGLLDDYFTAPIAERTGAVAGAIEPAQPANLLEEWAASREIISQARALSPGDGRPPGAATANLLVRRRAWEELGGFQEGVVSGADFEFCWRLQDAGWRLAGHPRAIVRHRHRARLGGIVEQMARYAAGNAWQNRRRPGSAPRPPLPGGLARSLGGGIALMLLLQPRRAAMKWIDGVAVVAQGVGYLRGNAARTPDGEGRFDRLVVADRFPRRRSDRALEAVAALRARGLAVRVEAVERPGRPLAGGLRKAPARLLEDDGEAHRAAACAWLALRHPLRCLKDLSARRACGAADRLPLRALAPAVLRLRRGGEAAVHAAASRRAAALATRLAALAGVPVGSGIDGRHSGGASSV